MGEQNKMKNNLMGKDKGSLIKKVPRKQRETKYLFSISHEQAMTRHFLGSRTSVYIVLALEDKCNNKCSLSSFLLAFIAEQASHGMIYPSGQFDSALPS